jgi:phosphatidylglycerol lysyltransferase
VLALVRRFGWSATSFQVLEPGYRYFFPDADACVAYVDTGRAWVAAGAPLADDPRLAEIAAMFVAAARAAGRSACFFATEERFAAFVPLRSFLIGEQAVWDPAGWAAVLRESRSLREQLRRARAKGVQVRALDPGPATSPGAPIHAAMMALAERWQRAHELAPMGFLAGVRLSSLLPDQRLFLAEWDGALVALLSVAPICGRRGWLLQSLLRSPDAPNGTAETLIDHAMREAVDRGRTFVTLGLAPLAGKVTMPLRLIRTAGAGLYNFQGLRAFKAKLRPARWDRIFLSFPAETGPARAFMDVLAAFAGGGLFRFGSRTLLRGPAAILSLLAWLLVPWTVLLATAETDRWFPHPAVKWVWVAFDALLAGGLFALRARWRDRLARLLTLTVAADAILTAVEGAWWNAPRTVGIAANLVLATAVAAPAVAFIVVSRATARRAGRPGTTVGQVGLLTAQLADRNNFERNRAHDPA